MISQVRSTLISVKLKSGSCRDIKRLVSSFYDKLTADGRYILSQDFKFAEVLFAPSFSNMSADAAVATLILTDVQ
jgi:hypothetical protein